MQLTIDSDQRLEDVLRVVGAMFNVTIAVQAEDGSGPAAGGRSQRAASSRGRRRTTVAARRAGRRPARGARGVSPADVRRWAADNGYQVASKGRVPASVMQAYAAAHA